MEVQMMGDAAASKQPATSRSRRSIEDRDGCVEGRVACRFEV